MMKIPKTIQSCANSQNSTSTIQMIATQPISLGIANVSKGAFDGKLCLLTKRDKKNSIKFPFIYSDLEYSLKIEYRDWPYVHFGIFVKFTV